MSGWMSSENVFVAPTRNQKRGNVTKVGRRTEKRTIRSPRSRKENLSPQEFALRAEQGFETALRCFPKLEKN